jgi:DNA-directed primase/polymerase protein
MMLDLQQNELFMVNTRNKRELFVDKSVYTRNRNFRLWMSSKLGKNNPLLLVNEHEKTLEWFKKTLVCDDFKCELLQLNEAEALSQVVDQGVFRKNDQIHCITQGSSGLVEIESHLLNSMKQFGQKAPFIRSFIRTQDALLLNIGGNRYCHRVQREHKSNGVYYLVDLKSNLCYQKCYDIDCKGFQSKPIRIYDQDEDYFDEIPDEYFDEIIHAAAT